MPLAQHHSTFPPASLIPGTSYTSPRTLILSGAFNTPSLPVRSAASAQHSTSDPCRNSLRGFPFGRRSEKVPQGRCHRSIDPDYIINIGPEAPLPDVMDAANKVLVGRVRGRTYSVARLKLWVEEIWGPYFKELPEVMVLTRGWFALHFQKSAYTQWVLSQFWHIELAPVLLKRWDPLFDPEREKLGEGPIWVHLPGLPWQFWNLYTFKLIGDTLGTYLEHDRSYEKTGNRTMARILVHMDIRPGLVEKITLHHNHVSRKKPLDYEGVPYRCRRCHKVGHLYKDCPLILKVNTEEAKGIRQPATEIQHEGDNIPMEQAQNHQENPSMKKGDSVSKVARKKDLAASGPPRTRSKTAVNASQPAATAISRPGKEIQLLTGSRKKRRIGL